MMAIMMDSRFKPLHIVENLVGCRNAIWLAYEYDVKIAVPFFMVCSYWLNTIAITSIAAIDITRPKLEKNMFGVGVLIEESSWALVIRELSLFRRLSIISSACANPLVWWQMHEGQFPNVAFLAKQILGVLGSKIETEWVMSI